MTRGPFLRASWKWKNATTAATARSTRRKRGQKPGEDRSPGPKTRPNVARKARPMKPEHDEVEDRGRRRRGDRLLRR